MSYIVKLHFTSGDKTYSVLREGFEPGDQVGAKGRHATQSCRLRIRSAEASALFLQEAALFIDAAFCERSGGTDTVLFEGVVRPYQTVSAKNATEDNFSFEIMDYTEILKIKSFESENFTDKTLGWVVSHIYSLADLDPDLSYPAEMENITLAFPILDADKYGNIADLLSAILFEFGYDYKFTPGTCNIFKTYLSSSSGLSVASIKNQLKVQRDDNWTDGVRVKYGVAGICRQVPIANWKEDISDLQWWRYTLPWSYSTSSGHVTRTVPYDLSGWNKKPAELKEEHILYASNLNVPHDPYCTILSLTAQARSIAVEFSWDKTVNYVWGNVAGGQMPNITVYGDIVYAIPGDYEEQISGEKPDEFTLVFCQNTDLAKAFAEREYKRAKVAPLTYSFQSLTHYAAGSFVRLTDTVIGINVPVRILSCNKDANNIYSIKAESADYLGMSVTVQDLQMRDVIELGNGLLLTPSASNVDEDESVTVTASGSILDVLENTGSAGYSLRWFVNDGEKPTWEGLTTVTVPPEELEAGNNTFRFSVFYTGDGVTDIASAETEVFRNVTAAEDSTIIVPEGYEVVTQYAFGELEKGAERWLADHDGTEDHRVWDKDSWIADLMWVDANEDGSCPLRPRAGLEIWKRQGIRTAGSSDEPLSWEVTLYNVIQSFNFTSSSFVFDRNTRSLDGDGYSVVGLVIDMQGQYGKLTLVTSAGVIGIAVDGVVTPLSASVSIDIPAREKVYMTNYVVMLPNNVNTKSVFVQALIGSLSDPRAYMSITLSTKDEASWAYLGLFTQDEISSYGTGGPTDATGKIMLGSYAGKQVVEGDIFVIKGINALNAEFLDIMTFIHGNWDYLSSHEDDDPAYDEKLMVLAPEVYSGNVDSTLLPSNFSFIENLVSKHVTAEFIGAKRIKLISTRDKLGAIYAGDVDFTKEHGKRVTSAKGFVLDGNGDAEIKNLDVAGNSFIHGDCTVGGTIANKVQDTDESVFFTNKDSAAAVTWGTTRNTDTRAVSKNGMVGLLASLCSGYFRSASGYVNPRGIHNYQVYGVFMHPTSGSAAAYSTSQNCPRNHNYTDTLTFLIPGYIPQSLFTVSWTAKWTDGANFFGAREVNRGAVSYSITNSRTGKSQSGTLMYADATGSWIGEGSLAKSGSTTLILEGGDTLSITFNGRGYAYTMYQNGDGSGSASITYAASNYSASEYDGGRDIAPAGAGNHVRGILYFVVNENNSASGARVALSFNSEIPSPSDGNRQDLLGRSFFELRDMDSATYDTGQYTAPFPFTSGLIINNSTVNLAALDYYYKINAPTFSGSGTVSSAMLALKSPVYHNDYSSVVNYGSTDIAVVTMSATMVKLALNNTNTIELTTSGYYMLGAGFYIDIETLSALKGSFSQNMMPIYNHDSSGNPTTRVGTANVGTQAEKWASVWAEYVNGNASSRKNKHDVAAFKGNALEILMRTLVVSFVYNKDIEPSGLTRYGFIAEDAPAELATERHDIMDEGSCIGILIKAMQEMYAELQELRRRT